MQKVVFPFSKRVYLSKGRTSFVNRKRVGLHRHDVLPHTTQMVKENLLVKLAHPPYSFNLTHDYNLFRGPA